MRSRIISEEFAKISLGNSATMKTNNAYKVKREAADQSQLNRTEWDQRINFLFSIASNDVVYSIDTKKSKFSTVSLFSPAQILPVSVHSTPSNAYYAYSALGTVSHIVVCN